MHLSRLLISLALAATWTGQAQAAGFSVAIAASVDGDVASDGPVMARAGQTVILYAVVATGRGRQARYATTAPSLTLRGRRIPSARLAPPDAKLKFAWWQVEPYPHHKNLPPPNAGNPAYSNAELFGPQHGRWLGYDTLEYHETPLLAETGPQLIVKRVSPTDPHVNVHAGLGTMRYKVVASDGAVSAASPGMEAKEGHGIARRVMRVSFRRGDDMPGRLTALFNVPNVFGSGGSGAQHQTDLFQGADCADVIIGALRAAGLRLAYTSVKGLLAHAHPVTPILVMDETGIREQQKGQVGAKVHLRFGVDVQPGDLMLIDYLGVAASPRTWDHVAVVSADAGVVGEFDPKDLVMHVGYLYGLTEEPAATQAPALVQFLRWNREVTNNLERAAKSEARGRRLPAPTP
jgi:hypothetical protein